MTSNRIIYLLQCSEQQTEPPPSNKFAVTVNQWVIYDSYVEYEYQKELQDEQERLAKLCDPKRAMKKFCPDKQIDEEEKNDLEDKFLRAARILERMVVQNIYCDIALGMTIKCAMSYSKIQSLYKK